MVTHEEGYDEPCFSRALGMSAIIKCRKCRSALHNSDDAPLLSVHSEPLISDEIYSSNVTSSCKTEVDAFYLNEVGLPTWILNLIEGKDWVKGKLNCPGCSSRLGSFDFVSGLKCPCGSHVVPPVHIVKSKVDCFIQ